MCGFSGILKFKGPPLNKKDYLHLKKMGHRLRFRGPDDEKFYFDSNEFAVVFRRLSIIDLKGGDQPMSDPSGSIVTMVNGEIYNYKQIKQSTSDYPYMSHSDSEVIIPLYLKNNLDYTESLNGMFAIAIWDRGKKRLILTRDRLGIKPLFYAITEKGHLIFASEIKALLAHADCPKEFDWEYNLGKESILYDLTIPLKSGYKGIEIVPPGHHIIIQEEPQRIQIKPWWTLSFPTEKEMELDNRSAEEVIKGYQQLLRESVEMQLMSDVEVAIALSGGIDSAGIAALANKNLKTFTINNKSTILNGDVHAAHKVSKYLGLPNFQLHFPCNKPFITYDLFKEILWACEMPLTGEIIMKYPLYRLIKQFNPNIKTILIGQGSDEFNGGYCHQWISSIMPNCEEKMHDWKNFNKSISVFKKKGQLVKSNGSLLSFNSFLNQQLVDSIGSFSKFDTWQYYQFFHTRSLTAYNLWHEDRTSAANQLETRVPYLDHRLVEYLACVPRRLQKKLFWEKKILRKSLIPFLPKAICKRPKVPFYIGVGEEYTFKMLYEILSANNQELLKEALLENPEVKNVLDVTYIKHLYTSIPAQPSYQYCETLISLASMGLLAKWVKEDKEIQKVTIDDLQLDFLK